MSYDEILQLVATVGTLIDLAVKEKAALTSSQEADVDAALATLNKQADDLHTQVNKD